MIRNIASVSCFALGLLLFSVGASAHHGGAAYDGSQTITVTGAVTKFEFINPHVLIYVAVADEGGKVVEWSGELTTPIRLARMDTGGAAKWSKDILQLGDEIMLSGNPARSGAPSLRLRKVIDSHGVALIGGTN